MKTPYHSHVPTPARRGVALFTTLALLLIAGCDSGTFTPGTQPPDESSSEPLPPNIRLRISYDQTEATYSRIWPPTLVGEANSKMNALRGGDAVYLTEYEAKHTTRSYDQDGYLTVSYEYIDGSHPHMNMPAKAYNDLKKDQVHILL